MEHVIFARFHARAGVEAALLRALQAEAGLVGAEPGCRFIGVYQALGDASEYWIHSRWSDAAAFTGHAQLPTTQHFIEKVKGLIDHPFSFTRAEPAV